MPPFDDGGNISRDDGYFALGVAKAFRVANLTDLEQIPEFKRRQEAWKQLREKYIKDYPVVKV